MYECGYVLCDRKNLNRVLLNLLSNAYKFNPEEGKIIASIKEIERSDRFASYEMSVKDSGIGMSEEFSEKMFTAFEKERTSTISGIQGTGLGLAITKNIVDMMNGEIRVDTAPGKGTEITIQVRFEIADKELIHDEHDNKEFNDKKMISDFSGKRLLLVEDNAINREIASMILSDMGFMIENAENGKIAVDMVSSSKIEYYDLILMDIQMPVMNGYEATKAIRSLEEKALSSIPIVAMTANAFKEDEKAAKDAGMQGHIAKPLDIDKIRITLNDVLQ